MIAVVVDTLDALTVAGTPADRVTLPPDVLALWPTLPPRPVLVLPSPADDPHVRYHLGPLLLAAQVPCW